MSIFNVLVCKTSGNPIVAECARHNHGEKFELGDGSPYLPTGAIKIETKASGNEGMLVPFFEGEPYPAQDGTKYVSVNEFINNPLILKAAGYNVEDLLSILADEENLDESVLDIFMAMAVDKMNEVDCEDAQEDILSKYEGLASEKNNEGTEEQIKFILCS